MLFQLSEVLFVVFYIIRYFSYIINLFKFWKFRKTDAVGFGCAAFHCFRNMIIRKDTTGIRDCPLGVPKMHSGASGFPLWSIGLSSMERRPMLHRAFTDHLCVVKSPSGDGSLLVVRLRIIISRNFNFLLFLPHGTNWQTLRTKKAIAGVVDVAGRIEG